MAGLISSVDGIASGTGCCPAGASGIDHAPNTGSSGASARLAAFVRTKKAGDRTISLLVPDIVCASCIATVERAASAIPEVTKARVNFSTKRLTVSWDGPAALADRIADEIATAGYRCHPFSAEAASNADADAMRDLIQALGISAFAAMNVMLLSVSGWAGVDMAAETKSLFHWLSALIALPTVAYAGRPFFHSAATALGQRRLNMDVPISLALILAAGMSLYQTIARGDAVYFDASVMLLFFLLLGRVLDLRVRARARSAAQQLLVLRSQAATVIDPDGERRFLPPDQLAPGMRVAVAAGARIPADGVVSKGDGLLDNSLLTGESLPESCSLGAAVFAGALNVGGPLEIDVTATEDNSLLAEIVRLMETAEQGRARYVRLADRVARAYAPAVHLLGGMTFLAWFSLGAGWETSLLNGITVLIITCPCALALAVPAVQVVAGGRLLRGGVLVKSGDALERLADIDTIVFDKTGTLTTGKLTLTSKVDAESLALAASLARDSHHPLAKAIVEAATGLSTTDLPGPVSETPGQGLSCETETSCIRLGSRKWVGADSGTQCDTNAEVWLRRQDGSLTRFAFADRLRCDAKEALAALKAQGYELAILSGDRPEAVAPVAAALGVADWAGGRSPQDKTRRLNQLAAEGRHVLMVGDGLNDAPALAAARVSLSPASAADIAQNAADFVSLGDGLGAVPETIRVARASKRLVLQNFALSFAYNALAVPVAMLGFATPLLAAIAMSGSSVAVTLNAMRLKWTS